MFCSIILPSEIHTNEIFKNWTKIYAQKLSNSCSYNSEELKVIQHYGKNLVTVVYIYIWYVIYSLMTIIRSLNDTWSLFDLRSVHDTLN